jgi:DNA-binding MarR family transcriptional regulator
MTAKSKTRPRPRPEFVPPTTISRKEFLRRGTDDWFREAIYITVQGQSRLLACREAFGRAIGLTPNQFAILFGAAYRQGNSGVSIRELAEHVALAPTHVTTEVGKLIQKGFLIKDRNTSDRRGVLVSLTPTGEEAVLGVAPLVRAANDALFNGIAAADLDALSSTMRHVVLNSELALAEIRRYTKSVRLGNNAPASATAVPAPVRRPRVADGKGKRAPQKAGVS